MGGLVILLETFLEEGFCNKSEPILKDDNPRVTFQVSLKKIESFTFPKV